MKVKIDEKLVQVNDGSNVFDLLETLKVNPETVLVKRKNKLVPHDVVLKNNDELELITVISGG